MRTPVDVKKTVAASPFFLDERLVRGVDGER
jgi:hypothetical protein